jgi:hypothetical protein
MRKTIATIVATAFLGTSGVAVMPSPAAAFVPIPFFIPVLMSKEDKNFKAVNPYDKPAKVHRHKKKKM